MQKDTVTRYQQLTQQERYHIKSLLEIEKSQTEIATILHRSKSTIYREIRRNSISGVYLPEEAHCRAVHRRKTAQKFSKKSEKLWKIVKSTLALRWSPEAISCRLYVELPKKRCVSHSTIYNWIEADKALGGELYKLLPRFGKRRWKGGKRKRAGTSLIPGRIDITERPKIVDNRERLGDWEGDTVHGQNASLVTLVDRCSRFTLCKRIYNKSKEETADAINSLFSQFHGRKKTLTLDNGGEFAGHSKISESHGIDVYFAHPYKSWQRGTNENTNGRLRRIWPKKFDMAKLSEEEIEEQIALLNITPRKVLGGLTPAEIFTRQKVALIA